MSGTAPKSTASGSPVWKNLVIFILSGIFWFTLIESMEHMLRLDWLYEPSMGGVVAAISGSILAIFAFFLIAPAVRRADSAEQRLISTEERCALFMEHAADAILVHDLEGRLLEVNQQACRSLGYSREELLRLRMQDIDIKASAQDLPGFWHDLPFDRPVSALSVHRRKDGRTFQVEVRITKLAWPDGPSILALIRDVDERERVRVAMQAIVEGTAAVTGNTFFRSLVRQMAQAFGVRYALVGILDQNDKNLVHALAAWTGSECISMDYRLEGTPCENVVGQKPCQYKSGVQEIFPHDALLRDMGAISYMGAPLLDAKGAPLGVLAVLDDKPMEDEPAWNVIMQIFAGRISAELERLDAERAMAESEEKYRRLLECANDAIFVADAATGIIVSANEQAGRLMNLPVEKIIGLHQTELHPAEERERYAQIFRHHVEHGGVVSGMVVVRADGQRVPVDIGAAIVQVGSQKLIQGIFRDVTERVRAEEALRESEQRYRSIFQNSADAILLIGLDGRVRDANPEACQLYGYEREEFVGKSGAEFVHPEHAHKFADAVASIQQGVHFKIESVDVRKDGSTFPIEVRISPLEYRGETVMLCSIRDTTEQKFIEETIRAVNTSLEQRVEERTQQMAETSARLAGIIDSAMDAIVSVDDQHRIVLFNPAAEKMFRCPAQDAIGQNLERFIPEPYRSRHHGQVLDYGEKDRTRRGIGRLGFVYAQRTDGDVFPAEIAISKLDTVHGRLFTSVIRDITERLKTEQALVQGEARLRRLSAHLQTVREEERAHIAHEIHDELGGMLTAIKIDLSFLDRRIPDNFPQLKEKAGNLVALTESAMQTVRKISSDLRPSILDNLGLLPALEWQAQEFQQRMGIRCLLSVEVEAIDTDQERATAIFRIFQEALTNVARHAQATQVRVGIEQAESDLILTVRDNGVGITKDKVLSIDSFGILGMHERARRFGGKVSIVGSDEGGTVVTLVFPLIAAS